MNVANSQSIKKHHGRDDLAGEHKFGDMGQIILFIVFAAGVLLDLLLIHSFSHIRDAVPIVYRIPFAIPLFVVSLLLFLYSHRDIFDTVREKTMVIDSGVYSMVRHPMYLAAILLYLSVLVLVLSPIAFAVWIVGIVFYVYIARYEEMLLTNKLGNDYERYMKSVPMFVPRLVRKKIEN